MARGLAVVATSVGGLPEIVEDGRSGWLIPPDSPSALADAIQEAASDRARLLRFGANARAHAREFSAARMVDRVETLYQRLLR
jgi:glycosyltransferase involved in cell wall biosynthesis